MANENEFLFHAFLMGIYITFIYDNLRVLRRVIPHGVFLVSLEDLCFWFYCAIKVFLMMYYESNGTLRWFAVLGALAGMLLYLKLVSPYFVKYASFVLQKIWQTLAKIGGVLMKPLCLLAKEMRKKISQAAYRRAVKKQKKKELGETGGKKKLTFLLRMIKMNL